MKNKMYFHYKEETVDAVEEHHYCLLMKSCKINLHIPTAKYKI